MQNFLTNFFPGAKSDGKFVNYEPIDYEEELD